MAILQGGVQACPQDCARSTTTSACKGQPETIWREKGGLGSRIRGGSYEIATTAESSSLGRQVAKTFRRGSGGAEVRGAAAAQSRPRIQLNGLLHLTIVRMLVGDQRAGPLGNRISHRGLCQSHARRWNCACYQTLVASGLWNMSDVRVGYSLSLRYTRLCARWDIVCMHKPGDRYA